MCVIVLGFWAEIVYAYDSHFIIAIIMPGVGQAQTMPTQPIAKLVPSRHHSTQRATRLHTRTHRHTDTIVRAPHRQVSRLYVFDIAMNVKIDLKV
jgi:hypothetical protein